MNAKARACALTIGQMRPFPIVPYHQIVCLMDWGKIKTSRSANGLYMPATPHYNEGSTPSYEDDSFDMRRVEIYLLASEDSITINAWGTDADALIAVMIDNWGINQ
jgi:hypothetical protein